MVLVYTILARCEKLARKNTTICVKNHHLCQYIVLIEGTTCLGLVVRTHGPQ
jgi:hypothetical protein